jgi:DNA-binding NarL/FixJ family response regulator
MNVLVVDDHPMVLEYLRAAVLRALPGASVRTAESLAGALAEANQCALGLVLLDLGLPGCAGMDSVLRFREAHPAVPVLVVSASTDARSIRAALAAGVAGFLPKSAAVPVLLNALRLVAEGGRYAPPRDPGRARAATAAVQRRRIGAGPAHEAAARSPRAHADGPEQRADRKGAGHRGDHGEAACPRRVQRFRGIHQGRAHGCSKAAQGR